MSAASVSPPGYCCMWVKFDEDSQHGHNILFKENKLRYEDVNKPKQRTLLVANIPPYCNKSCLRRLFSKFGHICGIKLEASLSRESSDLLSSSTDFTAEDLKYFPTKNILGFHYGFVVFTETESLVKAVSYKGNKTAICLSTKNNPVATGMTKWINQYCKKFPNKKELQENVDAFMSNYDSKIQMAEKMESQAAEEVDEDGWIKVTRKGKNPVIPRTEARQIKLKAKEKMRKKKKELLNAYSYQIRESKREKIAELRKKFEEDKERVETMRHARRFRPF